MNNLIPEERIESKIYLIRGQKVMLDRDLAELYKVETRQLKRAVRRNIQRFPKDFMFTLNHKEIEMMVCYFGTPSRSYFGGAKPYAFTEHGILMLSSILNSKRAIQVSIQIMRTFTKLRKMLFNYADLHRKIEEMEKKYDKKFRIIFDAIKELMRPPVMSDRRIGFLKGGDNK